MFKVSKSILFFSALCGPLFCGCKTASRSSSEDLASSWTSSSTASSVVSSIEDEQSDVSAQIESNPDFRAFPFRAVVAFNDSNGALADCTVSLPGQSPQTLPADGLELTAHAQIASGAGTTTILQIPNAAEIGLEEHTNAEVLEQSGNPVLWLNGSALAGLKDDAPFEALILKTDQAEVRLEQGVVRLECLDEAVRVSAVQHDVDLVWNGVSLHLEDGQQILLKTDGTSETGPIDFSAWSNGALQEVNSMSMHTVSIDPAKTKTVYDLLAQRYGWNQPAEGSAAESFAQS